MMLPGGTNKLLIHFLLVVPFSSWLAGAASASSSSTSTSTSSSLRPDWLSIHGNDKEALLPFLQLARKRHDQAIQKARDSYYSFSRQDDDIDDNDAQPTFDVAALQFDEYDIQAAGKLPDFANELERKILVTSSSTPLFTPQECDQVIGYAEAHFAATNKGQWTTLPSGQYNVAGFWIRNVPAVHAWFNDMIRQRLFPLLQSKYPNFVDHLADLCVDNAYLFKYTPETGRRTDVHTDSGCLSFTIALNSNQDYQGGGTWFEGLQTSSSNNKDGILEMNVGQCTIRPGGVRHCGHAVTSGTRYIIGGFCMNAQKVEVVRMLLAEATHQVQQQGNLPAATQALEAAIAINPAFDGPYSHLADLWHKQGHDQKAQQVLEHCLHQVNPQCGEVAYSLGSLYYLNQGEYAKAQECMQLCLELDDCDVDAMMVMAQTYHGMQDFGQEEEWLQRIVDTHAHSSLATADAVVAKAFCNLGVLKEGTDMEADYYRKSIALNPQAFPSWYSLGCVYASQKQWGEAVQAFQQAVKLADDDSSDERQALQNLYRVTMPYVQEQFAAAGNASAAPPSREEMTQLFVEIIGPENYKKLAAMQGQ